VVAVAGGRVFSASLGGLYAYPASGCGRPSCTAAWADRIYAEFPFGIHLGGVDAHQLFVTYTESTGNGATSYIKRLSATTGATQWSATVDGPGGDPIRGGSTVWLREGCIDRVQGITATCILGFAASGTGHRPLLKLTLPSSRNSASGGLAISGGTLVDLDWYAYVTGYRVPGT
jgi:hypothetical protein